MVTALAAAVQAVWLWGLLELLAPYALLIDAALTVLAVVFVLYVASKRDEPAYKILWLIAILSLPLFGTVLYLCFGDKKTGRPWPGAWSGPGTPWAPTRSRRRGRRRPCWPPLPGWHRPSGTPRT